MKLFKFKHGFFLALVMVTSLVYSGAFTSNSTTIFDSASQSESFQSFNDDHETRFSIDIPSSTQHSPIENKVENNEVEVEVEEDIFELDTQNFLTLNLIQRHFSCLNNVKLKSAKIESDNFKSVSIPSYILFHSWKSFLI